MRQYRQAAAWHQFRGGPGPRPSVVTMRQSSIVAGCVERGASRGGRVRARAASSIVNRSIDGWRGARRGGSAPVRRGGFRGVCNISLVMRRAFFGVFGAFSDRFRACFSFRHGTPFGRGPPAPRRGAGLLGGTRSVPLHPPVFPPFPYPYHPFFSYVYPYPYNPLALPPPIPKKI